MSVHDLPVPPAPVVPPRTIAEMIDEAEDDRDAPRLAQTMQTPAPWAADDNPFKLVARYRKARKIADALRTLPGATTENVATLGASETVRAMAARLANTNVPSEVTWALVVELVRERTES